MENAIAVISPSSVLTTKVEKEIKRRNLNIHLRQAFTEEAVYEAEELILKGTKIIISRGHTAAVLRKNLDVPVVDIKHTFFDIYQAYKKAKTISDKVVFLASSEGFEYMLRRSEDILHGIQIISIDLNDSDDIINDKLRELVESGIKVAVGGLTLKDKVENFDIKYIMSEADEEAVSQGIEEALHLLRIELEREDKRLELERRYEMINAILNCVTDGVISYDVNGEITNANYYAKKILGKDIIGKNVNNVFGTKLFMKSITEGQYFSNELYSYNNTSLIINLEPIKTNNKIIGSVATLQKSREIQEMEQKIRYSLLRKGHVAKMRFSHIVGESDEIIETKNIAKKYAETESTVLIYGETGTGKELFAQSIHNYSDRRNKPFVAINCGAFPANLLESELFGYVKGAFTGALSEGKTGIFELAHGGTIFLDEISETPLEVQIKLLRVIQERKIVRIGDDKVTPIDVRIIAATNKDLRDQVLKGLFREDLYYRICVLELKIPNLQQRKEDIPMLIDYFIKTQDLGINLITNKALNILKEASWPGNVRQLSNVIERLSIISHDKVIDSEMVIKVIAVDTFNTNLYKNIEDNNEHKEKDKIDLKLNEEKIIRNALIKANGNRKKTADLLGISTTTLWRRMKKYKSIDEEFLEQIKYL